MATRKFAPAPRGVRKFSGPSRKPKVTGKALAMTRGKGKKVGLAKKAGSRMKIGTGFGTKFSGTRSY